MALGIIRSPYTPYSIYLRGTIGGYVAIFGEGFGLIGLLSGVRG